MKRFSPDDYYDAPMREFPLVSRALMYGAVCILYVFSKLMWRWRFDRPELIRPAENETCGSVIICNHTSMAEVVVLVCQIHLSGRRVRPIAKQEFFNTGIVTWAFSRAGAIPVLRGTADMKACRRAARALKRGEDVLIFPEGTRIRDDRQKVEIHGGFALIARMAHAKVAPMAVCGFRDITPQGARIMRPCTCWLRAGERVSFDSAPDTLTRHERLAWLERDAMRRVYELRDELRAEHPGRR